MAKIGEHIGNYELLKSLGDGGFAEVFLARHRTFGETYAIKVLFDHHTRNEAMRKRFTREAMLQRLHGHPHIVKIHDIIDEAGVAAIVMELVEGGTLEKRIETDWAGSRSFEETLQIMTPLLEAVAFIHGKGVVHRDLKPENVLLDESEEVCPPHPKLADFGIAKDLQAEVRKTGTGARMGTWVYGAPELFQDAARASTQADVFSLAMILRRLVTGRLPLDPDNERDVWSFYLGHAQLPDLADEVPDLPASVVSAIERCLAVNPEERLADAQALLEVLQAAAAGSTTVSPGSLGPQDPQAAEAQYQRGEDFSCGQEVEQSYEDAVRWFRLAAGGYGGAGGYAPAQYGLGLCFRDGRGVGQSGKEAVRWFRLAAEQGHAGAQFNLGDCYRNGKGVEQSHEESVRWYRLAAKQGHAEAQES